MAYTRRASSSAVMVLGSAEQRVNLHKQGALLRPKSQYIAFFGSQADCQEACCVHPTRLQQCCDADRSAEQLGICTHRWQWLARGAFQGHGNELDCTALQPSVEGASLLVCQAMATCACLRSSQPLCLSRPW